MEMNEELEVAAISDSRRRRGRVEYYIQWVGMDHATWEDEDNVTTGGAEDILDAFHRRYPTKLQTQRRSHPRRRGAQPLEGS